MSDEIHAAPFWRTCASQDFAAQADGLSTAEARKRLKGQGPNLVSVPVRRRLLHKIWRRVSEPLVAILIIAGLVSALTGDLSSFVIISLIVAFSIALDVLQEHRAEEAAEALKRSVAIRCNVLRDRRLVRLPVAELVAGDVVHLSPGDLVPADGIVLDSHAARINQALLTGEPYAVEKNAGAAAGPTLAEATSAVFSGTGLVTGTLTFIVIATGPRTQFGMIAAALEEEQPPTAFERGVHALGLLILRLTAFLVLFVLLAQLSLHRPVIESFLFAIALAVGLTPELLPMIMTVTLARGAMRMAARQVVVKRLTSIHDLGAMDVLCTDKTGTLTQARIELLRHENIDGQDDPGLLDVAAVNAHFAGDERSPMDEAILAHAPGTQDARLIAQLPFDFERRCASVLVERDGVPLLIVKGAPEYVLARCTQVRTSHGDDRPLEPADRAAAVRVYEEAAADGLRCLAVGVRRSTPAQTSLVAGDEVDLTFLGLCMFMDPPKESATAAIGRLRDAGIRVKIISGDAGPVVQHLVRVLGLDCRGMLTGDEIEQLEAQPLALRCEEVDLFVRVTPAQKMRIIRALQSRAHTVGFLGDGINDAPAIKAADAGLSVDGATEVARDAADMILLNADLNVLADGVEEGRRTYANITKYVRMGTSSNFGNMVSMAIASVAVPFLPLTPVQVLLNNLLYDLSETGIPFDRVEPDDLATPHAWDMKAVLRFTMVMGPLSSVFDLATFVLLLALFQVGPETFRTAWFIESMATQILVIFLIRTSGKPWRLPAHPVLVASSLGALALAVALPLSPAGPLLGFGALPTPVVVAIALLVLTYLVAAEVLKRFAMGKRRTLTMSALDAKQT